MCGHESIYTKSDALEQEKSEMVRLSKRLAVITKSDNSATLKEARKIISELREVNLRWNDQGLDEFLTERQRELFYS